MALADVRRYSAGQSPGWGLLLSEVLLTLLLGLALVLLVWRVPDGRGDVGFLALVGMALQSVAFVRLVVRVQTFLDTDCPDCEQNFHGFPDRAPVPFRRHCAHCGAGSGRPAAG